MPKASVDARKTDPVTSGPSAEPNAVLQDLLNRNPVARVSAISPDGNSRPVPDSITLGTGQTRVTSPGLAGYVPEDRPGILAAFERALNLGAGHAFARALSTPDVSLTLYLVNLTVTHDVLISISVVSESEAPTERLSQLPVVPPRVARIKKSDTAAIIEIDEATSTILGWTAEDVIGRRTLEFIHPDDQPLAIENWLHLRANPSVVVRARMRHQAHDGTWIWFETSQVNCLDTAEACVIAEMVDISTEMAAQQALEAREQLLHQLTQALPLGVFQIDALSNLIYTNDRLFDVIGQASAATSTELFDGVAEEQQASVQEAMHAVLSGAAERTFDVQLMNSAARDQRTCQISLRPLVDAAGQVVGAVGCVADITESAMLRRELEKRATLDSLTGCHNRSAVMARLEHVLADSTRTRTGTGTGTVFVDLDLFKTVNDQLGHAAGNELLIHVGHKLRSIAGPLATVGRIGGDEFLIVVPDLASAADCVRLGERIAAELRENVILAGGLVACSASVGVAWSRDGACEAEQLVAQADADMYASKRARKRRLAASRHLPTPRGSRSIH
jgi:diguanylate cyclase (GGDEF)-like protein/PAS domain S-box-containing protein